VQRIKDNLKLYSSHVNVEI
jgi:hypothetical protein